MAGKTRIVPAGPKAQELLLTFRPAGPATHLFSPALAVAELHAGQGAAGRKTSRFPSHMARNAGKRKANPEWALAAAYTASCYGHAVVRACDRGVPASRSAHPAGRRDGIGVVGAG